MISLQDMIMKIGTTRYPISSFEVWFKSPRGITPFLHEAIEICESMSLNPEFNIVPQAVAVNKESGMYEMV